MRYGGARLSLDRQATDIVSTFIASVQRIEWAPGFHAAAHDHRMWAAVGVYSGSEHNRFHLRLPGGLADLGGRVLDQSDVLVADAAARASR